MTKDTFNFCHTLRLAVWLMAVLVTANIVAAQTAGTPEDRVRQFYSWYLSSINAEKDPAKNRTLMGSHLSVRFNKWFYSKTGQNLDYDIFTNGQDWNQAWAENINTAKAVIKGNTATVKLALGSPPDEWVQRLSISLVKENGKWKIDRITGGK